MDINMANTSNTIPTDNSLRKIPKINLATLSIIVIMVIIFIIYAISIYIMYDKETYVFREWDQKIPQYACQPLISITPLTTTQQENIQTYLNTNSGSNKVQTVPQYVGIPVPVKGYVDDDAYDGKTYN